MILHHETSGEGAPALLMGGSLGTSLRMWRHQLPLAERRRLLRFDHRGHGASPEPPGPYEIADLAGDVVELMDALGLERAGFCGLSIGGMVGMWLAANRPDRVERLVLICTAAHMPPASAWRDRAATVLAAGSTAPIAEAVVERWLTPAYADAHPEARDELLAMLRASPVEGYAACCGAIERMDLRAELPRIRAPTLVISGADDQAAPPALQAAIAGAIPGARHEVLGPAAHVAVYEQADRINHLIEEHLA